MKPSKKKQPSIRKNIDLPKETVAVLDKLAADGRMKTKPYMEVVLIEFAHKNKAQ